MGSSGRRCFDYGWHSSLDEIQVMRWKQEKFSDSRVVTKFLFIPRLINGEWRWLERASFRQHYWACEIGSGWSDVAWVS